MQTAPKHKLPGAKLMLSVATLVMLLTVGGSAWLYVSGLQTLRTLTAQNGDNAPASPGITKVVNHASHWALQMGLAAVAGGAGLFLVAVTGSRLSRGRWMKRHAQIIQEVEAKAERLLGQLADAKVLEEEARKAYGEAGQRLAEVSNAHTTLQRELDQRKQAERSLAQQTQQLERSKDVLEMHVQARTQELQKMQRRNELILNSAGEGICGFDLQGRATFVNPAVAKITGWKIEELIGKSEDAVFFPVKSAGAATVAWFA